MISQAELASKIDHTLLGPEATQDKLQAVVQQAKDYQTASVCVSPDRIKEVAELLKGSGVLACTVIGFPHGTQTTAAKAFEAQEAVKNGAEELDMVMNVGFLKDGRDQAVKEDIEAVVEASGAAKVKVIIESALLTDSEIIRACQLAEEAGADFVKTSTGYASAGGASVDAVRLMKETVGNRLQVKASGGIRSLEDCLAMLEAGADRIGASRTQDILTSLPKNE